MTAKAWSVMFASNRLPRLCGSSPSLWTRTKRRHTDVFTYEETNSLFEYINLQN